MIRSCRDKEAQRLLDRKSSRMSKVIERATRLGGSAPPPRKKKRLPPIHPGEVLQDLLAEAGITVNALALALRVPANRIGGIVKGQRGITPDTALRLARYFGTSARLWVNLQAKHDLDVAEDAMGSRIQREILPRRAA
jgi:antitoxin HigA-1